MNSRFLYKVKVHEWWLPAALMVLIVRSTYLNAFEGEFGSFWIIFLLFVCTFINFIYNLATLGSENRKMHQRKLLWLSIAILIAPLWLVFNRPLDMWIQKERVNFDSRFQRCAEHAVAIGNKGNFAVCQSWNREDAFTMFDAPYTNDIIYDSTDEIFLKKEDRSEQWNKVVLPMLSPASHIKVANIHANKILGHYYDVVLDLEY